MHCLFEEIGGLSGTSGCFAEAEFIVHPSEMPGITELKVLLGNGYKL